VFYLTIMLNDIYKVVDIRLPITSHRLHRVSCCHCHDVQCHLLKTCIRLSSCDATRVPVFSRILTYAGTFNHDGEIGGGPVNDQTSQADSSTDDCAICMCPPTQPKRLPCGHSFCTDCIRQAFAKCQPKCPTCGYICGMLTGNQPGGQMTTQILQTSLAGYEQHSTIKITYDIPDGIQDVSDQNV